MMFALNVVGTILVIIAGLIALSAIVEMVHVVYRIITLGLDDAIIWFHNNHSVMMADILRVCAFGTNPTKVSLLASCGALLIGAAGLLVACLMFCLTAGNWGKKRTLVVIIILAGIWCGASFFTVKYLARNGVEEIQKLWGLWVSNGKDAIEKVVPRKEKQK